VPAPAVILVLKRLLFLKLNLYFYFCPKNLNRGVKLITPGPKIGLVS